MKATTLTILVAVSLAMLTVSTQAADRSQQSAETAMRPKVAFVSQQSAAVLPDARVESVLAAFTSKLREGGEEYPWLAVWIVIVMLMKAGYLYLDLKS